MISKAQNLLDGLKSRYKMRREILDELYYQ